MELQNSQIRGFASQKITQIFKIYQAEPIFSNSIKLVELQSKETQEYNEAEFYADYLAFINPYNHTFIEMIFINQENEILFSDQQLYKKSI